MPRSQPPDNRTRFASRLLAEAKKTAAGKVHLAVDRSPSPLHRIDAPRLSLCVKGRACYRIVRNREVVTVQLAPGDVLYIRAGCAMEPQADAAYRSLGIVFHAEMTRFLIAEQSSLPRASTSKVATPHHRLVHAHPSPSRLDADGHVLCGLIEAGANRDPRDLYLAALLKTLLLRASEMLAHERGPETRSKAFFSWQAACHFIDEHLNRPLGRKDLARFLGAHPNHVSRLFRRFARRSFKAHVLRQRLARARRLLREAPNLNVADVAAHCGFSSPAHFSRVYRRAYRQPPGKDRG